MTTQSYRQQSGVTLIELLVVMSLLALTTTLVAPAVILAVGSVASNALLGVKQPLAKLRNKIHEFRGIPTVVTYHPAALLRNPNWKKPTWDDVRIARQLLDRAG